MSNVIKKFRELYLNSEISKRISRTYAICFMALIFLMNAVLWVGVSYALYHPAEATIQYSMKNIQELLSKLEDDTEYFNPNSKKIFLLPVNTIITQKNMVR